MSHLMRFCLIAVIAVAGLSMTGCNKPDETVTAAPEQSPDADRIRELEEALANAQRDRAADQAQIQSLRNELERLRAEANRLPKDWQAVPGGAMIAIEGTVLFDSGKADLKASSRKVLADLAAAIQQHFPDQEIYIFGHTDNEPIKHSKWDDNYELSAQRALSVLRSLASNGVDQPMAACGWGENRPVAENSSAQARQRNRRVEIFAMKPR